MELDTDQKPTEAPEQETMLITPLPDREPTPLIVFLVPSLISFIVVTLIFVFFLTR